MRRCTERDLLMVSASLSRRRSDFSANAAKSVWIELSVESPVTSNLSFCSDFTVWSARGMISESAIATGAAGPCLVSLAWALTPRSLKLVAGGLVAAWLLTAVVTAAVLALVAARV